MSQVEEILKSHPQWAAVQIIYHELKAHGYKAFLAGGCVRDALLGVLAHDLDVASDARPDQIEALFNKTVNVGKAFGVMRVLISGQEIEVATFRRDGEYKDGRHPDGVSFSSPEEDAQRRDFTVNALFYDLETSKVLDFVEGKKDLDKKILRAVGLPEKRFQEDHLRILRAVRFVAQLDFQIEEATYKAVQKMASLVKTVSGERLRDEMFKLLKSKSASKGLVLMESSSLMLQLFPFRLRNNNWRDQNAATELWQFLTLFFREAHADELQQGLEILKLSVKEKRAIEKSWSLLRQPADFLSLNLGRQLQKMPEEGFFWSLNVLRHEERFYAEEIKKILFEWENWGRSLPKPFLSGDDLKGRLHGKMIGECLGQAFELQLERNISDRAQALKWLGKYLQEEV